MLRSALTHSPQHLRIAPLASSNELDEQTRRAGRREDIAGASDSERLTLACSALRQRAPELSAGSPTWPWQKGLFTVLAIAAIIGGFFAPRFSLGVLLAVLTLPFFCVVLLRAWTLWEMRLQLTEEGSTTGGIARLRSELPRYSILVPLFREARMVPELVQSLAALDYPRDKLEILLVVEACDPDTTAAARLHAILPHMRIVEVPEGQPQTKPKALNYALAEAAGDYVVVYDAEDQPETDQLLRAVALFRTDTSGQSAPIGCLQARLNIYNSEQNWFTRQFTIEYSVLFDCILPVLQRLRLPVPLGGTSNHFPRRVLEETGGWDPFNVTEDADLGIRFSALRLSRCRVALDDVGGSPRHFQVLERPADEMAQGLVANLPRSYA